VNGEKSIKVWNMEYRQESIADCVSSFRDSVLKHQEFSTKDSKVANRHYHTYIKALKKLNNMGDDGLSALAVLLDDANHVIRETTAAYLIHRYTDKAIKVLTAAAKAERPIGGLAIVTLKRWELGRYLDPATGKEVEFRKPAK
jgi:hypothetical protein